jgi:hypothetical protein
MDWPSDQMSANELLRPRQSLLQQNHFFGNGRAKQGLAAGFAAIQGLFQDAILGLTRLNFLSVSITA